MQNYDVLLSTGDLVIVQAENLETAVETAIWEYSQDAFILAVYPTNHSVAVWHLVETRGFATPEIYFTLEGALASADDGTEILIAVPANRKEQ